MKVESENEREVAQSCLTLCDPVDRSPPGSSVHVIFQARVLEWGAITFSVRCHYWKKSATLYGHLSDTSKEKRGGHSFTKGRPI